MDAEQSHRRLVSLCAEQINPMPPSPALKPHVAEAIRADAAEKAERVIEIVRKWDRGERF